MPQSQKEKRREWRAYRQTQYQLQSFSVSLKYHTRRRTGRIRSGTARQNGFPRIGWHTDEYTNDETRAREWWTRHRRQHPKGNATAFRVVLGGAVVSDGW